MYSSGYINVSTLFKIKHFLNLSTVYIYEGYSESNLRRVVKKIRNKKQIYFCNLFY
jgi:hypothetical protein